jgi:hypothetical protein
MADHTEITELEEQDRRAAATQQSEAVRERACGRLADTLGQSFRCVPKKAAMRRRAFQADGS